MTELTEYEPLLIDGLCRFLHAAGVAWYDEHDEPGTYEANPTPDILPTISIGAMPTDPDLVYDVSYYAQREVVRGVQVHSVQIRVRTGPGDRLAVWEHVGGLRRLLHRRTYLTLGPVRPSLVVMGPPAWMGVDENTPPRPEVACNFDFMGLPYVRPVS